MTFKADWEKTYTSVFLSDECILNMLSTYYVDKNDIKSIAIIEGGCANINVLVHLKQFNDPVILRVYVRDKESAYREQKLSALLKGKLPVPRFLSVTEDFGYVFAIIEWLPGKTLRDVLLGTSIIDIRKIMFKVGAALGSIANITFPKAGFFNQNLEVLKSATQKDLFNFFEKILESDKVNTIITNEKKDQIKHLFEVYKHLLPDETEKNLVHADFDPANILVLEKNGEIQISGILDWEFSFSGSTLWDVANMLRYAHECPKAYQDSFLEGLVSTGYLLPGFWQIKVDLLNIISLLDCLSRSGQGSHSNQIQDIKALMDHLLLRLRDNSE